MLRCVYGVTVVKPGHQIHRNARYGQMSRPSHCSLHQEKFTFDIRNACFQQRNMTRGYSVIVWVETSWYSIGYTITLYDRITEGEHVDRLGKEVHSFHDPDVISEQRSFQR